MRARFEANSGASVRICEVRGSIVYQPQQSVLKPQDGQRQTACIRNMSAPQRSQANPDDACVEDRRSGVDVSEEATGPVLGSAIVSRRD
jgi:hypothetical protein